MLTALLALQVLSAAPDTDPFAFFRPSVNITGDDQRRLDGGQAIAHVLPAQKLEVAVLAAVPVDIDGDRLVAWMRRIEALKKSKYVLAIQRFSDPPRLDDLADLTLEDDELSEVRDCQPGHCGLKLSAEEMTELQRAAADAGAAWEDAVQQRFRQIVLRRVSGYLAAQRVGPFANHASPVWPAEVLARLVDRSAFLTAHVPQFAERLRGASSPPAPGVESFLYWSKERVANRPMLRVTDVNILRSQAAPLPDVLVAGKEIFSTHYVNGSLGLTALMPGKPGGPNYLVYVNRSEIDVLHGVFGGITRLFIQRRLKAEAANVLQELRRRLESGEPSPLVVTSSR